MDDRARPVVADVAGRLNRELAEAEDLDTLARTLLTGLVGPGTFPCVHGAALGLVEGAGRRLRFLSSERDLGRAGARPDWTHVDAFDDVPLNWAVRTREPVTGRIRDLGGRFAAFCRERADAGTVSLAVLPLEPVVTRVEVAAAEGSPDRPLGALALYYDSAQPFDPQQCDEIGVLARVVSYSLRQLSRGSSPHASVPGDPRADGAAEAATMLPNDERAPAAARRFLRERLRGWGVSEDISATAELCLSELVTNAVIHAGSPSHLLIALIEGMLEVCVRDHGGPPEARELVAPADGDADTLDVYGRGLMLVESLSSDWGADVLADGTSVWFTLTLGDTG